MLYDVIANKRYVPLLANVSSVSVVPTWFDSVRTLSAVTVNSWVLTRWHTWEWIPAVLVKDNMVNSRDAHKFMDVMFFFRPLFFVFIGWFITDVQQPHTAPSGRAEACLLSQTSEISLSQKAMKAAWFFYISRCLLISSRLYFRAGKKSEQQENIFCGTPQWVSWSHVCPMYDVLTAAVLDPTSGPSLHVNPISRSRFSCCLIHVIPWSGGILDSDWLQGVH